MQKSRKLRRSHAEFYSFLERYLVRRLSSNTGKILSWKVLHPTKSNSSIIPPGERKSGKIWNIWWIARIAGDLAAASNHLRAWCWHTSVFLSGQLVVKLSILIFYSLVSFWDNNDNYLSVKKIGIGLRMIKHANCKFPRVAGSKDATNTFRKIVGLVIACGNSHCSPMHTIIRMI